MLSANDAMEQPIAVHAFQRFRRRERRAASAKGEKHCLRREFLLPTGNFCELGHVVMLAQSFSL
jgi:hypothetical protein